MRILMTTDTAGGVWNYSVELSRALEAFGVDVALATMGPPLSRGQRAEVSALRNTQVSEGRFKLEWMQEPWQDVAEAGGWLLDRADEVRPDVVHLNNFAHGHLDWPAPVLMVGHSCVLSWFEAVRSQQAGEEWNRYRAEVARGLRSADLVVAPTRAMLAQLNRFYGPLPHTRAVLNGRDLRLWRTGPKEELVFAAGRVWDDAKNIRTLAGVADRIRWQVAVAGSNQHPDGGRAEFPGVKFVGQLSVTEMPDFLARASIYALPARYEPFGLSVLEAALSGCALVLGDIPTLREIWEDAALFVGPDDADGLAERVNSLIAHSDRRERLARKSRDRAAQFTSGRMAREYVTAYHDLLERQAVEAPVGRKDPA